MSYNPFDRGPSPVGVRTIAFRKDGYADALSQAEVWYPATEAFRGVDLEEAQQDRFTVMAGVECRQAAVRNAPASGEQVPLLIYCHGGYGHLRDNAALATHLASHGYVVVAPRFFDSIADMGLEGNKATIEDEPIDRSAAARPRQASWSITQVLEGADPEIAKMVDPFRIGSLGGSLGGYTALELNAVDHRISATVALTPTCGYRSPIPGMRRIFDALMHPREWRDVATTIITGDEDVLVIVDDVRDLFESMTGPKRLVVMHEAGHLHMFDNAGFVHEMYRREYASGQWPDPELDAGAIGRAMRPFAEMLSEQQSSQTVRAIALAHLDAFVKRRNDARAFLDSDLEALFLRRGVTVNVSAGVGV